MFVCSSFVAIDVFLKSFIIVSTHRQRHVASETGSERDSPNPKLDSDSLIKCSFFYWIQIWIHYVSESRYFNRISPKSLLEAWTISPAFVLMSVCINFGAKFSAYYCVNKWWTENSDKPILCIETIMTYDQTISSIIGMTSRAVPV